MGVLSTAKNLNLMKQPLVAVALFYTAGVVLAHFVEAPLLAVFAACFVITFAAMFVSKARPFILPVSLFLFGWLTMTTRSAILSPHDLRSLLHDRAALVSVRGKIVEAPSERLFLRNGNETSHTLGEVEVSAVRLQRGEWQQAFGHVMSRTAGILPAPFVDGQTVEITGIALQPLPAMAEGVFDYARYLNLRGIHHELKVDGATEWKIFGVAVRRPVAERFRTWAQATLARGLPEQDESLRLQWAMLLGWQTALTSEVSEPFMRSGTMHIFAISGLHIALIAGIFLALLRAITLPRFLCGLIVIPVLWFYTAATGWQASAIRSTVMMTVIILGWMLKRPTDLLNSLAAAACIILVWQPEQLFQASFQLSFFVVLSLALLLPPIEKLKEKLFALDPLLPYELRPRWQKIGIKTGNVVWKCFATSLAAFVGSVPLIAYYFHLLTPGSLFANLVVVPVSSLALMSGLGALITGDFIPILTEWFNNSGWFWMRAMVWLSESAANVPAAWCYVRAPGAVFFVLYYGLLIAGCAGWFAKQLLRWSIIACAVVLATIWAIQWQQQRAWHRVTVLPLNGSHGIYAQPSHGAPEWLINSGDRGAVEFTLKPFLQAKGVNRIENLILTHGDSRYVGGAARLNEMFPVKRTLVSPIAFRSSKYREVLSELESKSRAQRSATNGLVLLPWTILHPNSSDRFSLAEDNAVVVLGDFDGTRVLLASDLGKAGQNAIFTRHPELRADIIVAGMPEKGEPLASEWIETLRPKLIVVSDSEFPATRRASPTLLNRLRHTGATVLATRNTGAVTMRFHDGSWRVETARPFSVIEPALETDGRGAPGE
jgi:ComEC/Rec2-related protein